MDPPTNGRLIVETSLNTPLLNIISLVNSPFFFNIDGGDNILNRSFNDQGNTSNPTDDKFIESLEKITFKDDTEICCGICLEEFKKGDEAFVLPCKDQKHYFHVGKNKETCEGILPWLKENNSCPICREKFPVKEDDSDIPVPDSNFDIDDNESENLISEFLQGITDLDNENISDEVEEEQQEQEQEEENTSEENIERTIDNFLENILINHIRPSTIPRIRIISSIVNNTGDDEEDFELQQAIQRSLQER